MKIREGFVSNSSSASYIVKIHGVTLAELWNKLAPEYSYGLFCKDSFVHKLIKTIAKFKERKNGDSDFAKYYEGEIDKLEEYLETLKAEDLPFEKFLQIFNEYNHISINECFKGVELKCDTSMHNSFDEGMSDIVQEIMFYMMSLDYKVTLEVDHD